ncbi:MAG: WD40/YVTN/BNR-like repeat-containing protein, partial [Armatimonadota bacterium]
YAGTEPSAVFRSTDGGETWKELHGLSKLPSASTWSFPPRPETHHVRWIGVDPHEPRRLYVAIEAGALVRSLDGGDTWIDRTPDGPYDTHTLALHPHARGRLYSAAGDGYYESRDEGRTWENIESGLRHGYLFGVAVDPADPEMVAVSAASGPGRAYSPANATSYLYVKKGNGGWESIRDGLPDPKGTTISFLATRPNEPHTIYAANNRGVFRSRDAGMSWEPLDLAWPERFLQQSVQGFTLET